ncbi:MAG: glycosyltransferase family 39 protein [Rhodospirillales bacterium]|nr:glycosyltransferase family 39 protein [Rhodospirillales bacterium]
MTVAGNILGGKAARGGFGALRAAAARFLAPEGRIAWHRLAYLLFGANAFLVLLTFADYGVTWDEDVHNWYGVYVLEYYTSFFHNTRALSWLNLYNYGAAFDLLAAILNEFSPIGTYQTRHLLNGFVGLVGVVGVWKLGKALGGPRAGFIAALLLLLMPVWYGHSFNNPKDIPFAVAVVWSTYYMVRIAPRLPAPPLALAVKFGVAAGLGLGVRVGGLLLFCYLGLLLTLWTLWRLAEHRDGRRLVADAWGGFSRVLLPAAAVSYPVMLLCWPWAQLDPIDNPLRALSFFTHETFPFKTIFWGKYFPATDLPWTYLPVHLVLKTPELHLALFLAAIVFAATALRRTGRDRFLQHFMLGFGIVFPVAYAIAVKAVLFDGMRHFIFVLPLVAVAAALAADRILGRVVETRWRAPASCALGLYLAGHLAMMVALHPDQYVYYNGLIGWTPGAEGKFKLDYWGNSYAEAVEGLEAHLRAEFGSDFDDTDFRVAVCGPPISAANFFPPNFIFTDDPRTADFFIAFTKDDCHKSVDGKEIFRVERMDTLLSVVLDRREINAARSRPDPNALARVQNFAVGTELE